MIIADISLDAIERLAIERAGGPVKITCVSTRQFREVTLVDPV
jgi:hypothetical protein